MESPRIDLDCLQDFFTRALPGAIRRLGCWQGLHQERHADVIDDIRQDIAIDYLTHRDATLALPPSERHERWLRVMGRSHYRMRGRTNYLAIAEPALDALPAPAVDGVGELGDDNLHFAEQMCTSAVHLKNGRINERQTARTIGVSENELRVRQQRLIEELGLDAQTVAFWRQRLVEALLGLAADVLRDGGHVAIHAEARRPRPDPRARLRRVLAIKARLRHVHQPPELRRVLCRYGEKQRHQLDPATALLGAAELAPGLAAVHLWRFELCVACHDATGAARALRAARHCGPDPVALVLARARLLELRGREAAARLLLHRAVARHRADPRLMVSLGNLTQQSDPMVVGSR